MSTEHHLQTTLITMAANVSNGTENGDLSLALGERKWFIIFKYSMYCIIFLISLIGNTMVCFVICRRMKVKSVTNYFIMNLAISDLLYTLCVPFDVYATVNNAWPYGAIMCRVLWPAQTMTITVSGFTLTALSVTRFWAVVKPLQRQLSVKQASSVIALLWIMATSSVIPYIIYLKLTRSSGACDEEWPLHEQRKIYTASLLVIQYILPIVIIFICYLRIAYALTKGQTKTANRTLAKARGKEARKVIKMLVIVTLTFAILTLPSSIMWMWLDFGEADKKFTYFWDVMEVLNVLDFLNCASNPIIYSFCNESFSREFRRQFGCVLSVPSITSNNSYDSVKVTTAFGSSSPGNGHETPLRASLSKHENSEQNADRGTLL